MSSMMLVDCINKAVMLAKHQLHDNGVTNIPAKLALESNIVIELINPQLVGLNSIDECLYKHIKTIEDLACALYGYALGLEETVLLNLKALLHYTGWITSQFNLSTDLNTLRKWNCLDTAVALHDIIPKLSSDIDDPREDSVSTPGDIFAIAAKACFDRDYQLLTTKLK